MILADIIRNYVRNELIAPARLRGQTIIRVKSGDIHSALGLKNRMPAVCGALDAEKFLDYAGVTFVSRKGPHQGSDVEWVFEILPLQP